MEGYEVKFHVYANSPEEAEAASKALGDYVNTMAEGGIAVTANHIAYAVKRWGLNSFVKSFFRSR